MKETNSGLLESFIETIESTKKTERGGSRKLDSVDLSKRLENTTSLKEIEQYRESNDQPLNN